MGRLRDRHAPRLTRLLQTRRDIGGVSHGRVVHAQVAADAADHDEAGVEALAGAEADAAGSQLGLIGLERPSDAERRVDGPARVVLMGDGGAEKRHDAVAEELVDRALVAVHLGQHQVEGAAHEPVDFLGFLQLESNAALVLTDSGGVQEETCILGVPCVTLRDNTERPETIEGGSNILAGTHPERILEVARTICGRKGWVNPFGDGKTGGRIVNILSCELA